MTDSITGFGATIAGGTTVSGGITAYSISLPSYSVKEIDLTSPDSTSKFEVFVPGMKNAGEITVEVPFNKSNVAALEAVVGGTPETWTITLSDGSTWACTGYISAIGGQNPYDDKVTISFTLKLSGVPSFTAAA